VVGHDHSFLMEISRGGDLLAGGGGEVESAG
jgi:hypothetical protein